MGINLGQVVESQVGTAPEKKEVWVLIEILLKVKPVDIISYRLSLQKFWWDGYNNLTF